MKTRIVAVGKMSAIILSASLLLSSCGAGAAESSTNNLPLEHNEANVQAAEYSVPNDENAIYNDVVISSCVAKKVGIDSNNVDLESCSGNIQSAKDTEATNEKIEINGKEYDTGTEKLTLYEISDEVIRKLPLFYNLKSLSLEIPTENQSVDLSPLVELSSVKYLAVYGTYTDFSFISGMTSLEEMYIDGFHGETLENFPINKSITSLQCDYCDFSDISWISNLKSLKFLGFGEVVCDNYESIGDIPSLENLRIGIETNFAVDFSFLKNLTGLKSFEYSNLSSNAVAENFSCIANCTELEKVYIYGNANDIEFCRSLKKLKEFSLQGGEGTIDISPLCDCPKIEKISLFCDFETEDYEKLKSTLNDCEISSHSDV